MWQEELNSLMFENLDLDNQERPMKASFQDKLETFIQKAIDEAVKEERERLEQKIGMIRQWLNEDRITDPKKMITSEDLLYWINK